MTTRKVVFSSLDQLAPTSYIRLFLVVRRGTADFQHAVEHLQQGLERTRRQLPYIGGSLFETESRRVGIEWDNDGPPPHIQVVPVPEDFPSSTQLRHADLPFGEVWRMSGPAGRFGDADIRKGLPAITITCMPLTDHLVLSVSCFHSLWDIAGLTTFLYLWSRNTGKPRANTNLPLVEDISTREDRLRHALRDVNVVRPTNFGRNLEVFPASDTDDLDSVMLQFDASKLKKLGEKLPLQSGQRVSVNDLANAVIWTVVSLGRYRREKQDLNSPRLRILVDARRLVFQPEQLRLPFLGNLVLPLFSTLDDEQTTQHAVSTGFTKVFPRAIEKVLATSQQMSPMPIADAISTLDSASTATAVRESAAAYNTRQLTSTSWSQAPMHVDFGTPTGRVEFVRIAPDDYKVEGMMLTLPRKRDAGVDSTLIEIHLVLRAEELSELQSDEVIRSLRFERFAEDTGDKSRARI